MTINSHSGQGKTRHLNVLTHRCVKAGMRVIYVNAKDCDFWLSASLPGSSALDGKARISQRLLQQSHGHFLFLGKPGSGMSVTKQQVTRIFLGKSDVSQLKGLYRGDDGESLAEAIRQNCCIWFPLQPGDTGHDA